MGVPGPLNSHCWGRRQHPLHAAPCLTRQVPERVRPRAFLQHKDLDRVASRRIQLSRAVGRGVSVSRGHDRHGAVNLDVCAIELKGEELAANCAVLITEWSTLAFVGLVRGIETHSYRDLDEMRKLVPLQHGRGARNIAQVCRELLTQGARPVWLRGVA